MMDDPNSNVDPTNNIGCLLITIGVCGMVLVFIILLSYGAK
jgi:hypothetical protein